MATKKNKVYAGDVGTEILLDAGEDITSATVSNIEYKKPNGKIGSWTGVVKDKNFVQYFTLLGDNTKKDFGQWEFMIYLETPSWSGHGETVVRQIYDKFK